MARKVVIGLDKTEIIIDLGKSRCSDSLGKIRLEDTEQCVGVEVELA